jgi:hypothetical protein
VQGQICNILRPKLAMNRFLPLLTKQIPTLLILTSGGRGRGGALILDRCRAFDLLASVDAHLCHTYLRLHVVMSDKASGRGHQYFSAVQGTGNVQTDSYHPNNTADFRIF